MKLQVQLVVCSADGLGEQVQAVTVLEKDDQRVEHPDLLGEWCQETSGTKTRITPFTVLVVNGAAA
jgi:hypothetical protein